MTNDLKRMVDEYNATHVTIPRAQYEALMVAAREATIAWACCASLHREYAKGKDPFYTTRQADFVKHEETARAANGQTLGGDEMTFPDKAWRDPDHSSNNIRPRVRCVGCGNLGCVTYWGPWCFACNVPRMDRLNATFATIEEKP